MKKKLVFISHISEEKAIAAALKTLVELTFQNLIEVFVSSDPTSNPAGGKWLDVITAGLRECVVEIILASPESVSRPWVNFEAGGGWVRGIPVIPLCHSGMQPGKLPAPLSYLMAASATDVASLGTVFPAIARAVGSALPEVAYGPFVAVVKKYEGDTRRMRELEAKSPIAPTSGLSPHEFTTLLRIAEEAPTPDAIVAVHLVRDRAVNAGLTAIAVSLALIKLERMSLVQMAIDEDYGNNVPVVRVSLEGWAWLESNRDRLVLTKDPPRRKGGFTPPPEDDDAGGGDIPF